MIVSQNQTPTMCNCRLNSLWNILAQHVTWCDKISVMLNEAKTSRPRQSYEAEAKNDYEKSTK